MKDPLTGNTLKTLHLMTQRDQPYGSERRCCERCGLMLVARPADFWEKHAYVESEANYHNRHADHWICETDMKPIEHPPAARLINEP